MSALTVTLDLAHLKERHQRAERLCEQAAEAERAAYLQWQEAYGAYELARDEASAALAAWVQALHPLGAAPGRSGLETKAGRAPRPTHRLQDKRSRHERTW